MTKQELLEFRRKLVKAKGNVMNAGRADGPLYGEGISEDDCFVLINGERVDYNSRKFYDWCYSVPLETVRLMYDNSIADLDKRIAKLKG